MKTACSVGNESSKWTVLMIVWIFTLLGIGCASEEQGDVVSNTDEVVQSYEAIGVVKTITPTKNYVNIDHEAIPGFMDAMAMFFTVPDTSILQGIAVDDSVTFTIEMKGAKAGVAKIQIIE